MLLLPFVASLKSCLFESKFWHTDETSRLRQVVGLRKRQSYVIKQVALYVCVEGERKKGSHLHE